MDQYKSSRPEGLTKSSHVLIVDALNFFLRSFAKVNHVTTNGEHIGGLAGFLKSLGFLIKKLGPTRVILVFDGEGGSTNKRYLYPEYKANRHLERVTNWEAFEDQEQESDAMISQIVRLIGYLRCLPVDIVILNKIEADDVVGYLVTKFNKKVTIVSTDRDYLQLVSDRVSVYSPTKQLLYSPKLLKEQYGVYPQNFLTCKIVTGDDGDNVPNVAGIKIKTLLKLFPELASEEEISLDYILEKSKKEKGKKYVDICNYEHQLRINKKLMDLKNLNIPQQDKDYLDEVASSPNNSYNMVSFLKMFNKDQLEKTIQNPNNWLSDTFVKLKLYKPDTNNNI